jgi:hypothetical protein
VLSWNEYTTAAPQNASGVPVILKAHTEKSVRPLLLSRQHYKPFSLIERIFHG